MRHADEELLSAAKLIQILDERCGAPGTITWFRGQTDKDWTLVPAIARPPSKVEAEATMIKRFKQNAASHLHRIPADEWEWMFLMQHYRAYTRLLDWSESPLCALFFALYDERGDNDTKDAALWFLDPVALNAKALPGKRTFALDIPACGIDKELQGYLPDQVSSRAFDADPAAVIGQRNSTRMVAQSGTFTIMHHDPTPVEAVGDGSHIWRVIIPAAKKETLRKELRLLGITEYALFPELDRVSSIAKGLFQ